MAKDFVQKSGKDFVQKSGIDFSETFAPVTRLEIIKTLIALTTQKKYKIYQLDVKLAFLNGVLVDEVYVEQPQRFLVGGIEKKIEN